jgi:hypothetical protein
MPEFFSQRRLGWRQAERPRRGSAGPPALGVNSAGEIGERTALASPSVRMLQERVFRKPGSHTLVIAVKGWQQFERAAWNRAPHFALSVGILFPILQRPDEADRLTIRPSVETVRA